MMKPLAEQMVFRLPPETETAVDSLRQTYNNLCVFLFFRTAIFRCTVDFKREP